ncbi:MAG: hypothetical protein ABI581_09240 [Sediminibacterium sp.]
MKISENISLLDRLLAEESANQTQVHEKQILQLVESISDDMLQSYDIQRQYIASLLHVYEKYQLKTVAYQEFILRRLISEIEKLPISIFNIDFINGNLSFEEQTELLMNTWEKILQSGYKQIRISNKFAIEASAKK